MRRALRLYEASDKTNVHWLVLVLLVPGTIGNGQLMLFLDEDFSRSDLPFLFRMAGRFFFAVISERWIEGRHAIGGRLFTGSRHAGPRILAF